MAIAEIFHPLMDIFVVRAENRFGAELFGDVKALCIGGNADDDEMAGAGEFSHERAEQSDRAGADHGHGIARANVRMNADSVVGDAAWFGERGKLEGKAERERHAGSARARERAGPLRR